MSRTSGSTSAALIVEHPSDVDIDIMLGHMSCRRATHAAKRDVATSHDTSMGDPMEDIDLMIDGCSPPSSSFGSSMSADASAAHRGLGDGDCDDSGNSARSEGSFEAPRVAKAPRRPLMQGPLRSKSRCRYVRYMPTEMPEDLPVALAPMPTPPPPRHVCEALAAETAATPAPDGGAAAAAAPAGERRLKEQFTSLNIVPPSAPRPDRVANKPVWSGRRINRISATSTTP